jgi:hypothetical protein
MTSDRLLKLVVVAVVLLAAWYASREGFAMGLAVAVVGLPVTYRWPVLGIPAAAAMAVAAVYLPGLAVAAVVVVVLLAIVAGFVRAAFSLGPYRPGDRSPGDGMLGTGGYIDGAGGWWS